MKPAPVLLAAIAATFIAASLTACGGETFIGDDHGHSISLRGDVLTAHMEGQPDATVDAAGDLSIGGKPIVVTPEERALLKTYHDQTVGIRQNGIEAGKAGAAMAGHAVSEAVSGMIHGDSDGVASKIQDRAKDLKSKAFAICENLETLQKTQAQIATDLPVFTPYASMNVVDGSNCDKASHRHD